MASNWNSVPYIHLIAQIEDRVFADRQQYIGDPDLVQGACRQTDR